MYGQHPDLQEAKLEAMQRVWQGKRNSSTTAFFQEVNETEDILTVSSRQNSWSNACLPPPQKATCSEFENDPELLDVPGSTSCLRTTPKFQQSFLKLDASTIGDLPAHYVICALQPHQLPVCGVYVDKRVVPGFKYRVRPLPVLGQESKQLKCLFQDRALILQSIGRGFARRFTFEADNGQLNSNDNYFYSDNRPEGYAFELEVISEGDKFTIFDINREAQGTMEVLKIEGAQLEISSTLTKQGIEKRANVKFIGKVEFYDTGVAKPMTLNGTVVALKSKGRGNAEVIRVTNVNLRNQRWYLTPGIQNNYRRVTVKGQDINDVPTKYTMTGLEQFEIPVVGTYVDPRIIPGFCYKVRPNNRRNHLFNGRALRLQSVGMGYAKRLTFEPDNAINANNYLWSDNHPDGLGLEPRAVNVGMKFIVKAGEQILGEATVFRDDKPQFEENTEKIEVGPGSYAIVKQIHIDIICHIQLSRPGGGSSEEDSYLMRVSGVAIVRKDPKSNIARVVEVFNIGLDSQLNILFAQTHMEIKFIPK